MGLKKFRTILEENCVHLEMHLTESPIESTLEDKDTEYQMASLGDGESSFFTILNGVATYTGTNPAKLVFNGSSQAVTDKACYITYRLKKNNIVVPDCETPCQFVVPVKLGVLVCGKIFMISPGDTLEVTAQADTDNVVLTTRTLNVIFHGFMED